MIYDIRPCEDGDFATIGDIINAAAQKYRGAIPDDCWHQPYMGDSDLRRDIEAGVRFCGAVTQGQLIGVMGLQVVEDVHLIRHAYVLPQFQGGGVGGMLLQHLCAGLDGTVLVGTWADATWAIGFYQRHGFTMADRPEIERLLRRYWRISERQVETSVVLRQA